MKLGISHLAWDIEESQKIFTLLKLKGVNNIEGVITKINDWQQLSEKNIISYKQFLNSQEISVNSLQSLFYKTNIDNLEEEIKVLEHFDKLIKYSNILNAKVLVFGSPSLRKSARLSKQKISHIFKQIDSLLQDTGIELSIEPNSKIYGGDFFYSIKEIVEFIKNNKFQNIKTMIDTHNLILENENPINNLCEYSRYINHIHISENSLRPLRNFEFHLKFAEIIHYIKYNKCVIYEAKKDENIEESIVNFINIYK